MEVSSEDMWISHRQGNITDFVDGKGHVVTKAQGSGMGLDEIMERVKGEKSGIRDILECG